MKKRVDPEGSPLRYFVPKQHRGQFYLIVAVIIIALIIGFAAVSNYASKRTSTTVYNLGEQLDIEGGEVLTFGTMSGSDVNSTELLEHFTTLYDDYAEGSEIYYIFGNSEDIVAYSYGEITGGSVGLNIGGTSSGLDIDARVRQDLPVDKQGNKIIVTIGDIEHEFEIKPGENFYFVISQELNGDVVVTTS